MLNYAFNTFKINIIKTKGEVLGKVRVERGKQDVANIVLSEDATELLKLLIQLQIINLTYWLIK